MRRLLTLFFFPFFLIFHTQSLNISVIYDSELKKYGLKSSDGIQLINPEWNVLQAINTYFYYGRKDTEGNYFYRYDRLNNHLIRINYLIPDSTLYHNQFVIIQSFPYGPKGVMNIYGKEILPTFYNNIWIKDKYILSELHNKITIHTLDGQKLFPQSFNYVDIKNGFIYVKIEDKRFENNEKFMAYNNNGDSLTKDNWTIVGQFGKDHLLLIKTLDHKLFYINESGEIQIKPNKKLNYEAPFSNGYSLVSTKNTPKKYGFIDTSGEIIIPLEYDNAGPFQKNYAFVEKHKDGKLYQGLIDNHNKMIKIFSSPVISRSTYYDSNKITYYLYNHETYDANGNYIEDTNLIK